MATSTPWNIDDALDDIIESASSLNPTFYHHDISTRTAGLASPKKFVTFADEAGLDLVEEKLIYYGDLLYSNSKKPSSTLPLRPAIVNRERRREEEEEDEEEDEENYEDCWRGNRGREMAPSPEPIVPRVLTQNHHFENFESTPLNSNGFFWSKLPISSPMPAAHTWMTDMSTCVPALPPASVPTDKEIELPDYVGSSGHESGPMFSFATLPTVHCPPSQEIEMESIEEPCFPEPEVVKSLELEMLDYDYDDHNKSPPFAPEAVSVSVEMIDFENDEEDKLPVPVSYPEQTPFEAELAAFLNTPLDSNIIENIRPSSLADSHEFKRYKFLIEELLANGALLYESVGEDYWAAIYRTKLEEFVLTRTDGAFDASEAFIEMRYKLEQDEMARDQEMAQLMKYEEEMKQKQQQRRTEELKATRRRRDVEAQEKQKKEQDERKKEEKKKHHREKKKQDTRQSGTFKIPTGPKSDFSIKGIESRRERY